MYTEYKELKLPEVHGHRVVRDFVFAVEKTSPEFTQFWRNKLVRIKRKGKELPYIFNLIKEFRTLKREEAAAKGKTLDGTFATTFKGELITLTPKEASNNVGKGQRPIICICGGKHKFKACYYLVPELRPEGWVENKDVRKKVDKKLFRNSRIESAAKHAREEAVKALNKKKAKEEGS